MNTAFSMKHLFIILIPADGGYVWTLGDMDGVGWVIWMGGDMNGVSGYELDGGNMWDWAFGWGLWIWIELGVWMVGDMDVGVGGRYGCREGGGVWIHGGMGYF